jgi:phosphatidylserine/phosphatidylglycerophosphate/cardiolipin synthase-like enzyme
MSTSASGKVVDQTGEGLSGLRVTLDDVSRVREISLGEADTPLGQFTLGPYPDDGTVTSEPGKQARTLRLRILVGQHILKEILHDDAPQPIAFGTITVDKEEATSWWATLGTGQPSRLSRSNGLRWLVDNEAAWGRAQQVIASAETLDIMQLQIDVDEFNADEQAEKPQIVLSFDSKPLPLDAVHKRGMDPQDARIERSILERVAKGKDVRIQIPEMRVDRNGLGVIGLVTGFAGLLALSGVICCLVLLILVSAIAIVGTVAFGLLYIYVDKIFFKDQFHKKQLERWFNNAVAHIKASPWIDTPTPGNVHVTTLRFRSNNLTHAKLVIDRGVEAVVIGSPFEQSYFNDPRHVFDDPRRGGKASKGPIHEMSVAVRGGAVGYLQELFNNHWNIAEPSDAQPVSPPIPSAPASIDTGGGEFQCDVQVVRTLDQMFTPGKDGEKGVLEAYLRAIRFASRFIYIENQYFNNDAITDALVAAVARGVKVILLLNTAPDMHFYLGWQQGAVKKIADSLTRKGINPDDRLGVFSSWTHEAADAARPKPTLVDTYLHTKSALIDNVWATVGSANLDGASLDYLQYVPFLLDGELRNTEANLVVFEGPGTVTSAVDALRRQLWAEHLGFADATVPELADSPSKDWLPVWRQRATLKKDGLMTKFNVVSPIRVLEFPKAAYEAPLGVFKRRADHGTALQFLRHVFSPDEKPSDLIVEQYTVIGEDGPPNFAFHYDAPGTPAPTAGARATLRRPAISAEPELT